YSFPLNSAKTVMSLTLPNDANVEILAITMQSSGGGTTTGGTTAGGTTTGGTTTGGTTTGGTTTGGTTTGGTTTGGTTTGGTTTGGTTGSSTAIVMPIEVIGPQGETGTRSFTLASAQASSAVTFYLQANNLGYSPSLQTLPPGKASISLNGGAW